MSLFLLLAVVFAGGWMAGAYAMWLYFIRSGLIRDREEWEAAIGRRKETSIKD